MFGRFFGRDKNNDFDLEIKVENLKRQVSGLQGRITAIQRDFRSKTAPGDIDLMAKFDSLCDELGVDIASTEDGLTVHWKSGVSPELTVQLPEDETVVGIAGHDTGLIVATSKGVYRLHNGRLIPIPFQSKHK